MASMWSWGHHCEAEGNNGRKHQQKVGDTNMTLLVLWGHQHGVKGIAMGLGASRQSQGHQQD